MLATLTAATLIGLDGRPIRVEVDVAPGLPGFTIVGLADAAIREARERVRGAIRNAGFTYPPRRITVNLAPADLPKTGASVDVAIAIGILLGSEQFTSAAGGVALIGELGLGGELRPVAGLLPMLAALSGRGIGRAVVPAASAVEAALVPGIDPIPCASLAEAVDALRSRNRARPSAPKRVALADLVPAEDPRGDGPGPRRRDEAEGSGVVVPDLSEVRGQALGRRALEVALAGGHGLLLVGPPGAGKTLLARTIPGLLPPLDDGPALAATVIASAAGDGPLSGLVRRPPVRAPHHTASYASIVGGGPALRPGEVTRADSGVLFLDELPEFDRDVLEALRQPLEDGHVTIARASRSVTFPARFQLVAAMNPCPCGFAGTSRCVCPVPVAERYLRRISGPLRDRIDIWAWMPRVPAGAIVAGAEPESSATVAARIASARRIQSGRPPGSLNGRVGGRVLRDACELAPPVRRRTVALAEAEELSGRGTDRLLRVARTIADLAGERRVAIEHVEEAARWRAPGTRANLALAS